MNTEQHCQLYQYTSTKHTHKSAMCTHDISNSILQTASNPSAIQHTLHI